MAAACGVFPVIVLALWALTRPPAMPAELVGYQNLPLPPGLTGGPRAEPTSLHLRYPPAQDGTPRVIGQTATFMGAWAGEGASALPGPHPLILIPQDAGWRAERLAWLATPLAASGFAVAVLAHPGTAPDAMPHQDASQRAAEVSAALDQVLNSPPGDVTIYPTRVDALGYGLGGLTVLTLAGAQLSNLAAALSCATPLSGLDNKSECDNLMIKGADLLPPDAKAVTAGPADPRIRRFIAVNPIWPAGLDFGSLRDIQRRVVVLDLPESAKPGSVIMLDAPRPLRAFAAAFAKGVYVRPEGLESGSFCPECTRLTRIVTSFFPPATFCGGRHGKARQAEAKRLTDLILRALRG